MSEIRDGSTIGVDRRPEDRREHRRMEIHLPVELRGLQEDGAPIRAVTRNVSTGGVFVELDDCRWGIGDQLRVNLTIPPDEGVSSHTGEASCEGEIIRCDALAADSASRVAVGIQFIDRLKLSF